jgi:hypothetical protein
LGVLNLHYNVGELYNVLNDFSKVVSVFFLNFDLIICHDVHVLSIKVDLVSHLLEVLSSVGEVIVLGNEFFYVCDLFLQVSGLGLQPCLGVINSLSNDLWNDVLDLSVHLFRIRG